MQRLAEIGFVRILNLMAERSQVPEHVVTQFVVFIDFEGFSVRHLASYGRKNRKNKKLAL